MANGRIKCRKIFGRLEIYQHSEIDLDSSSFSEVYDLVCRGLIRTITEHALTYVCDVMIAIDYITYD